MLYLQSELFHNEQSEDLYQIKGVVELVDAYQIDTIMQAWQEGMCDYPIIVNTFHTPENNYSVLLTITHLN